MATWRDTSFCGWLFLPLLLLLLLPPASAQALSYQDAVRRAVDSLNQHSADPSLFRLLNLESEPPADEDPQSPKPVSFTVKETVCPKTTQLKPEQCDFKEHGLVKRCSGTVTLDPGSSALDIHCTRVQRFRRMAMMGGFFRKAKKKLRKIGRKLGRAGRKLGKALGKIGGQRGNPYIGFRYRF